MHVFVFTFYGIYLFDAITYTTCHYVIYCFAISFVSIVYSCRRDIVLLFMLHSFV